MTIWSVHYTSTTSMAILAYANYFRAERKYLLTFDQQYFIGPERIFYHDLTYRGCNVVPWTGVSCLLDVG